ncbi:4317_t:CDS:2 [Acaulospora colombiana]|uniref:4317_t:CDS:1 n=1 Tax=Acaulospora colombiana TaxID=27376 RepID=A0ACA9L1D9_9GLOM|nr:4317_t:CDS:2 [Acaulospora colombiana]
MSTEEQSKQPFIANPHSRQQEKQSEEYDEIIIKSGCSQENQELQLCFADKRDWRLCKAEMAKFKECWRKNHDEQSKDQMST